MQTVTRPSEAKKARTSFQPPRSKRKRFSPLMFVGVAVTIVIIAGASLYLFTRQGSPSNAKGQAAPNPDCALIVPANPLTAQGLATPYQLLAANPKNGPCHQANPVQSAFIQAAVVDPATGKISIYNPLVTDKRRQPAKAPVVP